jgi:DNA-binding transcriptional MerR regulator
MVEGGHELTIDQLARRTGMSARNIRAHQSRGLLAPPQLRGRTGYYNEDHVTRIELIQELQSDGYSLDLIHRMLRTAGGSTAEVLRFTRGLHAPFLDEQRGVIERSELQRRFHSVLAELGVPVEQAIEVAADVRRHTDAIATTFLQLFLDNVWPPVEEAGQLEESLEQVRETLQRLRPLTSAAVLSLFQMSMGEAAESQIASELQRIGEGRS